ncbi:hypothetical protein Hdeb2414_s0004g00140241 [Helianthus debilis subsp. tardiflorus]
MWSRCQETVVAQVVCSEAGGGAGGWWGDGVSGHRFKDVHCSEVLDDE